MSGHDEIALVVGLLLSSYAFCSFVAAPGLGALSDRFGRRPVLLVSLAGSVVGYLLLGIGGALWVLFTGRVIDGLTGGNVSTAFAYVADVTEPADRAKYYGMIGAGAGLGFMFGPPLGGFTAQISVAAPLFLAAGITVLNLVWGYVFLPESLGEHDRIERVRVADLSPFSQFAQVLTVPSLARLLVVMLLFLVAFNGLNGNGPVYLKDVYGWSAADIGTMLFVAGLGAAVTQGYLVRRLVPRFGAERVAAAGVAAGVLGLAMVALTSVVASVPLVYAGAIVFVVGDGLFEPSNNGLMSAVAGRTMQGRVQGASQALQSVARVVGPLLANWVYLFGAAVPWIVEAALAAVALVVLTMSLSSIRSAGARAA